MVILNPLEPWPGELVLDAAATAERVRDHPGRRLRRALLGRPRPRHADARARPPPLPAGRLDRARARADRADAPGRRGRGPHRHPARLRLEPGPSRRRLRRPDADPGGRRRTPARSRTSAPSSLRCRTTAGSSREQVAAIRAIGDNTGSMKLKGANPEHEGDDAPDRWGLSDDLAAGASATASRPSATWPTSAELRPTLRRALRARGRPLPRLPR